MLAALFGLSLLVHPPLSGLSVAPFGIADNAVQGELRLDARDTETRLAFAN